MLSVDAAAALPVASLPWAAPVNAPVGKWFTLETPHFLIHYPQEQAQVAQETAVAAEEAHRKILQELQYLPEEKTHVVIADVSDIANALTTVAPYNQIILFPVFPDNIAYDTGISAHTRDWLRQLMTHEYAHVLHLDMHTGTTSQVRRMFGKIPGASTPNVLQGMGVIEGYATWAEGDRLSWGRPNDALYDMYLRAAVMAGLLPTWDQLLGNYDLPGWQPGPATYLYGSSFIDYIAQTYGEEHIGAIHRQHAAQPHRGSSGAFAQVLDVPFAELWQAWQDDLQARYQEQTARIENPTELTVTETIGHVALWPTWHPQGTAIVYGSAGGVVTALRMRSVDSGTLDEKRVDKLLINGMVDHSNGYAWHPDGSRLIYGKLDYWNNRLQSDLYIYNFKTRQEERLTTGYRAYAPTLSPNGEWVAFLGRQTNFTSHILVASLTDRIPLRLWEPKPDTVPGSYGPQQVLSLAWSPRGDYLAFSARDNAGRVDLYLLPLAGSSTPASTGAPIRLLSDMALDTDPAWSPDGEYLFFTSDRGGIYNIHVYKLSDGTWYRVTNVTTGVFSPAVSPDGSALLVSYYSAAGYDVALLSLDPQKWEQWSFWSALLEMPSVASVVPKPATDTILDESPGSFVADSIRLEPATDRLQRWTNWAQDQPPIQKTEPWRLDLARFYDVREFTIRPYSPAETLRPRYWSPIWLDESGFFAGGSTGVTDAIGRHAYGLEFVAGRKGLQYGVGYEYRPGLLGLGSAYGFSFNGRRSIMEQDPDQNDDDLLLDGPGYDIAEVYAAWQTLGVRQNGRLTVGYRLELGNLHDWELYIASAGRMQGGNGYAQRSMTWAVKLAQQYFAAKENSVFLATWEGHQYQPGRYRLTLTAQAGLSHREHYFKFTQAPGVWQLRGLSSNFSGQGVIKASVECELVAWQIRRGIGEMPLFFKDLKGVLFTDGGAAYNGGEGAGTLTAGIETRLSLNLGFADVTNELRVGVAREVLHAAPWRFYVSFDTSFM
jgi:Tol biopolymer transport system component